MTEALTSKRLEINGIVQGVGFRPFIYQLANHHGLNGEVANTATGVSLMIEGPEDRIRQFIDDLPNRKPPLAHIVDVSVSPAPVTGFSAFSIVKSRAGVSRSTLISPDVRVCDDCLAEMRDATDRRFGYPFINCTNCGPRYTIIDDVPYDRPKTSMRHFTMCPQCQAEYDDPDNRRFHAQPNACPVCGPRVTLCDAHGKMIAADDPIADTAVRLRQGQIVAIKGLGGFHLAVDATHADAVARLRRRKHREEKPFALMCSSLARVRAIARVEEAEARLLVSIQRPIVLLAKREPSPIADSVSPRNRYFGIMLPYAPLHHLLLDAGFTALVMTSANLSDEPIAIDNTEAFSRLGGIADAFLVHDRDILLRTDDSIVRYSAGHMRPIRRSRGYVPVPVFLREDMPPVLACGAELKNTICLTRGRQAFVSQHIGDLENRATDDFFRLTVEHLKRILDIDPRVVACDLHPDYLSTRYARELSGLPCVGVQHHHAHIAACMAENQADGPVIGLAFDGTGLGTDGTVWGGEVLVADCRSFTRAACLAPVPMPGSAAAIREPWRMAVAHLNAALGEDLAGLPLPLFRSLEKKQVAVIMAMMEKQINSPLTSSLGRLFDAVAAMIGLRGRVAFEGQAAMELEMILDATESGRYPFAWDDHGEPPLHIAVTPIIRGVVRDLTAGLSAATISARFHNTLIGLFDALCRHLRSGTGIDRVALSGGVFQNHRLLTGLTAALEKSGFDLLTHRLVPANDGGLSLGQAVVAAANVTDS
ncbi:carbamoyltransferase HypF [Desulfosarcina alkanivorans]|uniref:Carbamoyltransferase n=1 Tax=Desulfosarcina alkanivorans TaxID=571177 RepID=A0A5K7YMS2_9BACT|nr:carbamoyltransferase HypF [Desulfosarcina alkanivorans]BBO69560.1 carbamoyltransferase HypF [Desulfosarcina alkanivorans]